jgi:large subunit ribosomal protein L16
VIAAPRRIKRRKQHRGRMKGMSLRANTVAFGELGLKVLEPCMLNAKQLEAIRVTIVRTVKKGAKMWFRIFPDYPYTRKPAETRMGKGKGEPDQWKCRVHPGRIILEIAGVNRELAIKALEKASYKLGVKTLVVERIHF